MRDVHLWAPRIFAVCVALFVAAFALDAVDEGFAAVAMHLRPALALTAVVAAAWRWPGVGGVAFIFGAVTYALMVPDRPAWILAISGPLFAVGLLYIWSWRWRREPGA